MSFAVLDFNQSVSVPVTLSDFLHALYERLCTAPLNRLPCYGALEVIVTLLLLLLLLLLKGGTQQGQQVFRIISVVTHQQFDLERPNLLS